MVSRVTLLEIDTLRVPADEAVALFRERVLPGLHDLDGFEGVLVLVNPDGKGMTISMWRDAAAAEASAGFAAGAVDEFVTLYRAPPGRETYEVALAELPALAAPAP